MSDNEKLVGEGTTPRGADWEVVTLTASAYEAAPGPVGTEVKPVNEDQERSSSDALLMSDHFVFPPSEHENLPIQTSFDEIHAEKDVQKPSTSVEDYSIKNDVGSERVQFDDEGKHLSDDDVEMKDDTPGYGSSHAEDDAHGFVAHGDGIESGEDFDEKSGHPLELSDSKSCDTGASCKCWLKKHMTCLYNQTKETNAIWSVVVAAALVGIVILGRWHKDKFHLNQLKWCSGSAVRYVNLLFLQLYTLFHKSRLFSQLIRLFIVFYTLLAQYVHTSACGSSCGHLQFSLGYMHSA
jgi:hypothetical protein